MPGLPEFDSQKLLYHPRRTDQILDRRVAPLTIELGPTAVCNHNCIFCAFDYQTHPHILSPPVIGRFFRSIWQKEDIIRPRSVHIAGDGEPLMHKDLPELVKMLDNGLFSVGLTTNGSIGPRLLQAAKRAMWLRVSINAGSEEHYKRIHQCQNTLDEVFENVSRAKDIMGPRIVGVQCLVLDQPQEDLRELITRCARAGVDYLAFKEYSVHPQTHGQEIQTTAYLYLHDLVEESINNGIPLEIYIRRSSLAKNYVGCLAGGTAFWSIASDGRVYPCAQFVGKNEWCFGNIHYQTYGEIIESAHTYRVLKDLLDLDCRSCRHPCRLDAANRYLHRINIPGTHDEFL